MTKTAASLALCTTLYPGVKHFLRDWYVSVLRQTDQNFQLWIALDGMTIDQAVDAMGGCPDAVWIQAETGETPAAIRQRVLAPIAESCAAVVLVDSDDILHPQRVAAARAALRDHELVACALRLVDNQGADLGRIFSLPAPLTAETVLPRYNVFGLSNSAWRCELLARCLPVPSSVELVDWFLATRAWLLGARIAFDPLVAMDYRQHAANMARVQAPFSLQQLKQDTALVRHHFDQVAEALPVGIEDERMRQLQQVAADVERFAACVLSDSDLLVRYLDGLNSLDPPPLWWSSVAHPHLKQLWNA